MGAASGLADAASMKRHATAAARALGGSSWRGAVACRFGLLHAVSGYCMPFRAIACRFGLLHAVSDRCMRFRGVRAARVYSSESN